MNVYSKLTASLLDDQINPLSSQEYLFTIYISSNHKTKLEVKQILKSCFYDKIKDFGQIQNDNLPQNILKKLDASIDNMESMPSGFAFFVKFDVTKDDIDLDKVKVITMTTEPFEEVTIDKVYSLDQLFFMISYTYDALIFQFQRQKCCIYSLKNGVFRTEKIEKNELLEFDLTKRNKRPSPFSESQKYFGGGEYKMQRREEDENLNFINQVFDNVIEDNNLNRRWNYLVVFYSSEFTGSIENAVQNYLSRLDNPKVLFNNRTIKHQNELEKYAINLIKKERKIEEKELIQNMNDEYKHFARGWNEVTKGTQHKKIEILFLKPSLEKGGYVYNKEYIYTSLDDLKFMNQIEESIHTPNIVPWIIKSVIQSGGRIILSKSLNLGKGINIAAKLRY